MALKSDRNELQTDISFFMNEVATRGGVVSISTGGSGAAMDQGGALVTYTAASGDRTQWQWSITQTVADDNTSAQTPFTAPGNACSIVFNRNP